MQTGGIETGGGAGPLVSVVLGVRNGAEAIRATIDSLTTQTGVDLEIVVVNDGSSDATAAILAELAATDPRLRVLERPGQGLTRSLIEGCRVARGEFIARQDVGDRSLPGRLQRQVACLQQHEEASLCSSHVRIVVPEGVSLEVRRPDPATLADGLTGPGHHGSVLMRRGAYERAGGYRAAFYFAQDIDLWSRMVELGSHQVVGEVLYEAGVSPGSISGTRRREQEAFHALIVGATGARRAGRSEAPWLERAEALSARCRMPSRPATARHRSRREADGAYFIGASLAAADPELSCRYLHQSLSLNPWHLRARLRLARLGRGRGS